MVQGEKHRQTEQNINTEPRENNIISGRWKKKKKKKKIQGI